MCSKTQLTQNLLFQPNYPFYLSQWLFITVKNRHKTSPTIPRKDIQVFEKFDFKICLRVYQKLSSKRRFVNSRRWPQPSPSEQINAPIPARFPLVKGRFKAGHRWSACSRLMRLNCVQHSSRSICLAFKLAPGFFDLLWL